MKLKRYTVTVGVKEWSEDSLDTAVETARKQVRHCIKKSRPAVVFDNDEGLIVALVTDDGAGLAVHRFVMGGWSGSEREG